jgi:hypothetical protein
MIAYGLCQWDRRRSAQIRGGQVSVRESAVALQLVLHIGQARLGRRRLAARTGLSEMTVRLEVEALREVGVVSLRRSGIELTDAGRARFGPLFERVRSSRELGLTTLQLDRVALAAVLASTETCPAWAHRDQAVREGATGLLMLQFASPEWCFAHDNEPIGRRNSQDAVTIEAAFPERSEGDRLIIAFGPDRRRAGLGLWRVIADILCGS